MIIQGSKQQGRYRPAFFGQKRHLRFYEGDVGVMDAVGVVVVHLIKSLFQHRKKSSFPQITHEKLAYNGWDGKATWFKGPFTLATFDNVACGRQIRVAENKKYVSLHWRSLLRNPK